MIHYLALLRGINVGGKNIIKMNDLRQCFESMGFRNVKTYIQSGNVIFSSNQTDQASLCFFIENQLSEHFSYTSKVALFSQQEMKTIMDEAPENFSNSQAEYKSDVIFLRPPLTPDKVISKVKIRKDIDFVAVGKHALYFWRLSEKASQSYLSKIILLPEYKEMTIRNWNTTQQLFLLLKEIDLQTNK